jgi:transposase|tara:strand:+ start:668 stop:955 length:288 start_codon:yes stop_codon:yes gene_type:complete
MKQSDDELRMQIDAIIRDNIQEVINDYVDEKEASVKESGLGFVKKEGEDDELRVNISKDEVDKLIQEYKKIKRQQKSNFSEIKKLGLLDKDGRPL